LLVNLNLHILSNNVLADQIACGISSGPYCTYSGAITSIYVNTGVILVYLDTNIDVSKLNSVGISGVTQTDAVIVPISENPDFAKIFYATALTARANGSRVTMQAGAGAVVSGYLKVDRIWY